MHEDTRIILVWVVRIRNTLRTVRRSLCIMHQFCSKGLQMSERGIDVPSLYCERVFANVASDWDGRGALVGQRPAASRPEDCVGVCGCEKSPSPPPPSGSVSSFLYVKGGPDAHERERERERERSQLSVGSPCRPPPPRAGTPCLAVCGVVLAIQRHALPCSYPL